MAKINALISTLIGDFGVLISLIFTDQIVQVGFGFNEFHLVPKFPTMAKINKAKLRPISAPRLIKNLLMNVFEE